MFLHQDFYNNLITLGNMLAAAKNSNNAGATRLFTIGFVEVAKNVTHSIASHSQGSMVKDEFAAILFNYRLQNVLSQDVYAELMSKLGFTTGLFELFSATPAAPLSIIPPSSNPLLSAPVVQKQLSVSVDTVDMTTPVGDLTSVEDSFDDCSETVVPVKITPVVFSKPAAKNEQNDFEDDGQLDSTLILQSLPPVRVDFNSLDLLDPEDCDTTQPVPEIPFEPEEEVKAEFEGKIVFTDPFADVSPLSVDESYWDE